MSDSDPGNPPSGGTSVGKESIYTPDIGTAEGTWYYWAVVTNTIRGTTNSATVTSDVAKVTVSASIKPVTRITPPANPWMAALGDYALNGTVVPSDATNRDISWSVQDQGGTGARITDSTLNTTTAGIVTVRATITDGTDAGTPYTQDFFITVGASGSMGVGIVKIEAGSNFINFTIDRTNNHLYLVEYSRINGIDQSQILRMDLGDPDLKMELIAGRGSNELGFGYTSLAGNAVRLPQIYSLALDESGKHLYLLVGKSIYRINLGNSALDRKSVV